MVTGQIMMMVRVMMMKETKTLAEQSSGKGGRGCQ
jgi:hypothetical protein